MANVLVGVTGSVAAIRVPELVELLGAGGHAVKVVATGAATYFFDPARVPNLIRDEDEWPGRDSGRRYERNDPVVHIELRRWADLFLIAPLDANTLAKLAVGLSDNCLTCVWRAWEPSKPVVLAPAMNTLMWDNPFTCRHLKSIAADNGAGHIPGHLETTALIAQINERSKTLRIVPPVSKTLACGDVGMGGLAELQSIAAAVEVMLSRAESKS